MADPALAQAGALKQPAGQSSGRRYTLRDKLAWRWRAVLCWLRYALVGRRRGVPGLVDFVIGNGFFRAAQVPGELATLGEILAERRPERAIEIGTAWGGTLFFLTHLASAHATILSVDLPGGMFGGGYSAWRRWFYRRFARRNQRLYLLQGDSHSDGTLERVKAVLAGQPLDYLFIDGDHRYEGVKKDFELYAPLVRRGGIIAFHDIAEHPLAIGCEVSRLWNQVKSQYHYAEIVENPTQGWAGIGVLYVD